MIDVNEILAEFFQKRPERDSDGVFHYLLQERNATLVVDTTPYAQWTLELLKDTLVVDCERNKIGMVWISNGIYRASITPFPVETIFHRHYAEDDTSLVFVGADTVARIDLPRSAEPGHPLPRIIPRMRLGECPSHTMWLPKRIRVWEGHSPCGCPGCDKSPLTNT